MELISTTVLAFIFLGEEPGLRQFAGALFILAGLAGTLADLKCKLDYESALILTFCFSDNVCAAD
jgi:hypothetical protein